MSNEFTGIWSDNLPVISKEEADKLWRYAVRMSTFCNIPLLSALIPALDAISGVRKDGKV
jgi:hypothetical protein